MIFFDPNQCFLTYFTRVVICVYSIEINFFPKGHSKKIMEGIKKVLHMKGILINWKILPAPSEKNLPLT